MEESPQPVDDKVTQHRRRLEAIVHRHEAWRRTTVNLIASENIMSSAVRRSLDSDLLGRYADYPGRDTAARRYRGNRFIAELETEAAAIACEAFNARYVELRPISGHIAGAAVLMGLCRPGDTVLEAGRDGGGHREAGRLSEASLVSLDVTYLPFDGPRFNVDVAASLSLIAERRPRAVVLGSSNFLFPHPVAEVAEAVHRIPGSVLIFDASHVMGFLAAGRFQDPLREGADIVFGSTHKTLPGPQGGIILSNRDDLMDPVTRALVPALVTNHHPFRIPGLALSLLEMSRAGGALADAVVRNANALGERLAERGLRPVCVDGRYTGSHTVLVSTAGHGSADALAARLEDGGLITTSTRLPDHWGGEGIRIGTQEITHMGATEAHAWRIADLLADILLGAREIEAVRHDAAEVASVLGPLRFTLDNQEHES